MPLPSLRTLRRRLQNVKFNSGILEEIFEFLKLKVACFKNNSDKHCMLVMNEMSITPSEIFDPSTNTIIGYATLGNHNDEKNIATHALVLMLAGIASRWKQIVGYYFTGATLDGNKLNPIICEIIKKAEEIGLRVHSVTSDMGAANMGMWKSFGIKASKYSKVTNFYTHPNDKSRNLYFFHDCVHAFKNLNQGLLNNKIIIIPEEIVKMYNLPSSIVKASDIKDLCTAQETLSFGLSLTPKLNLKLLDTKNHFQKMKVSSATNVLNHSVATALNFVGKNTGKNSFITTAWFVSFITK